MKNLVYSLQRLAITFLVLTAVSLMGHCSTTGLPKEGSESIQEYIPHIAYLVASPIEGQVFGDGYTNIRFRPYKAPMLFDESILFCGDVSDKFKGKFGLLAITYDSVGHQKYRGIACHDLLSVSEVIDPD